MPPAHAEETRPAAGEDAAGSPVVPGTLYVVATPIGNLADVTFRALAVLGHVDRIAAEDTRRTRTLLARHGVSGRIVEPYHEHNEARMAPRLADRLRAGEAVALVTDAGTPGVSDPGYRLVRAALAAGAPVVAVPGPSAALCALAAAGLPTDRFLVHGFPPRKPGPRRRMLAELAALPHTLVFFEAPSRVLALVADIQAILGDREIAVARELTKRFEELWRGTARAYLAARAGQEPRGEVTVVVAGLTRREARAADEARAGEEAEAGKRARGEERAPGGERAGAGRRGSPGGRRAGSG